jgi:ATP sulfurylase
VTALVKPHGGALVERTVQGEAARELLARARRLPSVELDGPAAATLALVASGGAAPLRGFMTHAEYRSVLDRQRLPGGRLFPLPVVLPVRPGRLGAAPPGSELALRDTAGAVLGTVRVTETFVRDLREEALLVHGTTDRAHPRVARLLDGPPGAIGGEVSVLRPRDVSFETAREVRLRLSQQAFFRVAAGLGPGLPELPSPLEAALDAVLARSLAGAVALDPGLPVVVAHGLPSLPPLASARELVFQALVLKNFGASHLAVPWTRRDLSSASALLRAGADLGVTLVRGGSPERPPAAEAA